MLVASYWDVFPIDQFEVRSKAVTLKRLPAPVCVMRRGNIIQTVHSERHLCCGGRCLNMKRAAEEHDCHYLCCFCYIQMKCYGLNPIVHHSPGPSRSKQFNLDQSGRDLEIRWIAMSELGKHLNNCFLITYTVGIFKSGSF